MTLINLDVAIAALEALLSEPEYVDPDVTKPYQNQSIVSAISALRQLPPADAAGETRQLTCDCGAFHDQLLHQPNCSSQLRDAAAPVETPSMCRCDEDATSGPADPQCPIHGADDAS